MLGERGAREEGVALIFAMLATLVIAGLVTVMFARSVNENKLTTSARDRESAIHVAEAGVDHVIVGVNDDDGHVTTEPGGAEHVFTLALNSDLADQKAWALGVASDAAQCDVIETDVAAIDDAGETCGIRPVTSGGEPLPWIFGVGFVPDRDNAIKTRVVKIEFDKGFFSPAKAILTNGDLTLGATLCGASANVHTNGTVTLVGGADTTTCADPDGDVTGTDGYNSGGSVGAGSGQVSQSERIPQIRAETVYRREAATEASKDDPSTPEYEGTWYDLCADGRVRAPQLDASGDLVLDASDEVQPCTGPVLSTDAVTYVGWKHRSGSWETTPRLIPDGVYYIHHANADISGNLLGASGVVNMTVISDAVGQIIGQPDTGDCSTRNGSTSGNISVTGVGGGSLNPYLQDLTYLADGDFTNTGNSSTTIHGVILAHEQVDLGGTVNYTGAVMAEGACDSSGSPVSANSNRARGNFRLTHNGDLSIPLDSVARITAWNEL